MFEVTSQIIIYLIWAGLIGWIIGYLMGKATCTEKSQSNEGGDNSHELQIDNQKDDIIVPLISDTPIKIGTQPLLLTEAREGGKDNLQLIKGVGKVLEALLNETGIYHLDQIANLTAEEVKWLDNSMSFPGRIEREGWVEQSQILAEGKDTEYSKRVER